MARLKVRTILLMAVFLCGVAALFLWQRLAQPKADTGLFTTVGEVAAEQASRLVNAQGTIVICTVGSGENEDPMCRQARTAFLRAMEKTAGLRVIGTESVTLNPDTQQLPVGTFQHLMRQHSAADIMVSFAGVPLMRPSDIGQLPAQRPKCIAVFANSFAMTPIIFERNVVHAAIVFRPQQAAVKTSKSAQTWFEQNFQVITGETVSKSP